MLKFGSPSPCGVRRFGRAGVAEQAAKNVGEEIREESGFLRACFKIAWGPVCAEKAGWRDDGAYPSAVCDGGATKPEAFSAKTLRAAGLLSWACVGSAVTAPCRDAPSSPPWPQPKSLAAGPHAILKQTLKIVGAARGD